MRSWFSRSAADKATAERTKGQVDRSIRKSTEIRDLNIEGSMRCGQVTGKSEIAVQRPAMRQTLAKQPQWQGTNN